MPQPYFRVGAAAITENMLKRKWSATILRYLDKGVTDPAEIAKNESTLSAKVLSERLRTMVRYGLVARYPRPSSGNVVEYRLKPLGKKILEMLDIIDRIDQELAQRRPPREEDVVHIDDTPSRRNETSNTPPAQPIDGLEQAKRPSL